MRPSESKLKFHERLWCALGGEPVITPAGNPALPEGLIWSYIVQLSSVLRTIHAHGLACRVMDPTKILLIDKTRFVPDTHYVLWLCVCLSVCHKLVSSQYTNNAPEHSSCCLL